MKMLNLLVFSLEFTLRKDHLDTEPAPEIREDKNNYCQKIVSRYSDMFCGTFVALLYYWGISLRTRWILFPILLILPVLLFLLLILSAKDMTYSVRDQQVEETPSTTWDWNQLLSSPKGEVDLVVSPGFEDTKRLVELLRNGTYGSRMKDVVYRSDEKSMREYIQVTEGKQSRGFNITLGVHVEVISKTRLEYSIHYVPRTMSWPMSLKYSKGAKPLDFRRSFYFNYFLPLQAAINEAYAREYLGVEMRGWRLGHFPYPTVKSVGSFQPRYQAVFGALSLSIISLLCLLSVLVVEEKRDGFKELLIMNGAPRWMLDIHWLVFFAGLTLPICLSIALIIDSAGIFVFMEHGVLLLFTIVTVVHWHAYSLIGVLMVFVQRPIAAIIVTLLYAAVDSVLRSLGDNTAAIVLGSMLSFTAGFSRILLAYEEFESANKILSFSNAFERPVSGLSVGLILMIMLLSTMLNIFLIIYFSPIFPGRYGIPKPWYWMCYRRQNVLSHDSSSIFPDHSHRSGTGARSRIPAPTPATGATLVEVLSEGGASGKETTPGSRKDLGENSAIEGTRGAPVGLQATHIVKKYGRHTAVNDVSILIPKNQNTVLLGHNGAGKTTLLSIFSGMISATSGTFASDQYIIFSGGNASAGRFKKDMGYCPQGNMLFGRATVHQHLMLFGLLKGLSCDQARHRSENLIHEHNLYGAKYQQAKKLSGGMQRKLCFSIAVINNPQYLFLDEPTSGLDLSSRRFVCDSLLARKGTCTVVISTHSMEEAELLGDNIAIMANGKLICHGSLPFLENRYGVGYKLTIHHDRNAANLKQIVSKRVPAAKLQEESDHTLTFTMAPDNVSQFPALLRELDAAKLETALTYSALDDVFLKVLEEQGVKENVDSIPTASIDEQQPQKATILQQVGWLFYLRGMWTLRNWKMTLFALVVAPALGFTMFMVATSIFKQEEEIASRDSWISSHDELTIDIYKGSTVLLATREGPDILADALRSTILDNGLDHEVIRTDEKLVDVLRDRSKKDLMSYRWQIAFSFDTREKPTALFSLTAYHSAPIALNALMNSIVVGKSEIVTRSTPIIITHRQSKEKPSCWTTWLVACITWILFGGIPILLAGTYFVAFPRDDRISHFQHLQMMTGLSKTTYWLTLLIWDLLLHFFLIFLCFYLILYEWEWISDSSASAILVLFLMYGLGSIPFALFLSLLVDKTTTAMLCSLVLFIMYVAGKFLGFFIPFPSIKLLYFLPWVAFTEAAINILARDILKYGCDCVGNVCELVTERASWYIWLETVCLLADAVLYMLILLIISSYRTRQIWSTFCKTAYHKQLMDVAYDDARESDRSVIKEKNRVDQLLNRYNAANQGISATSKQNDPEQSFSSSSSQKARPISENDRTASFISDNIGKMFSPKKAAVCDVTFAIDKGECFGLLGANGSGKTTTFRILAGNLEPTKGDAFLRGIRRTSDGTKYTSQIGYCPQFGGLLSDLSAKTLLTFYAGIRGTPRRKIAALRNSWITALDMDSISRRPCGTYSGGNKRKLSLALAMLGDIHLVLLDEPTTGVDLLVTRRIWKIIKYSADTNNLMIILSTHSMAECEAICGRLTIMVDGVMKCLGTAPQLKEQLGAKSSLHVKFSLSSSPTEIEDMRKKIETTFKPHIHLLSHGQFSSTYTIDADSLKMYEVFNTMVKLKNTYPVIEDFAAGDATLDQVFEGFVERNPKSPQMHFYPLPPS